MSVTWNNTSNLFLGNLAVQYAHEIIETQNNTWHMTQWLIKQILLYVDLNKNCSKIEVNAQLHHWAQDRSSNFLLHSNFNRFNFMKIVHNSIVLISASNKPRTTKILIKLLLLLIMCRLNPKLFYRQCCRTVLPMKAWRATEYMKTESSAISLTVAAPYMS